MALKYFFFNLEKKHILIITLFLCLAEQNSENNKIRFGPWVVALCMQCGTMVRRYDFWMRENTIRISIDAIKAGIVYSFASLISKVTRKLFSKDSKVKHDKDCRWTVNKTMRNMLQVKKQVTKWMYTDNWLTDVPWSKWSTSVRKWCQKSPKAACLHEEIYICRESKVRLSELWHSIHKPAP